MRRILPLCLAEVFPSEVSELAEAPGTIICDSGEEYQLLETIREVSEVPCTWHAIEGATFLPGYAQGSPMAAGSLATAKVHCEAMGSDCVGITLQPCRWNSVILYSLRAEAEPQISPQGETSWLKFCGEDQGVVDDLQLTTDPPGISSCMHEPFSALREASHEYYALGVVTVNLLIHMGTVLRAAASSGWKQVASVCAPAVLQTLLLRQEERIFVDREEQEGLQEIYLEILHDMLGGDVHASSIFNDTSQWPLQEGFKRVRRVRELRSRTGRPGPQSVDFVLCFCSVSKSPGGGYPEVEDEVGWLAELLAPQASEYRNSTRIFVKEKCGDAAPEGFEESLQTALLPYAHVVEVHHVDDALRADDATAYLDHLAGPKYYDLADWTFFLHADAPEHVHPFRLLEEVVSAARRGALQDDFPFLYLSHNYLDLGTSIHTWDNFASPRLWKKLFQSSIAPSREVVKGYCCVQFLVPRPRALLRTQQWYRNALEYFASESSYFDLFPLGKFVTWQDLTCRAPAQLWMPWWHVVFGEALSCPERHQDPRLPLFIQLRSIPPDRILCC